MWAAIRRRYCGYSTRCRPTSCVPATGRRATARCRLPDQSRIDVLLERVAMTSLDTIRDSLPDYARDLRLNLGSVLAPTGAPGLTERQIWAVALSAAIASRHVPLARDIE